MTSFCVFGIKYSDCVIKARKILPGKITNSRGDDTKFTLAQWGIYCDLLAEYLFIDANRLVQISAAFDAPQFARDWIDLANKGGQIRRPAIMAKGQKVDKHGNPVRRKGRPVIGWIPYRPTGC